MIGLVEVLTGLVIVNTLHVLWPHIHTHDNIRGVRMRKGVLHFCCVPAIAQAHKGTCTLLSKHVLGAHTHRASEWLKVIAVIVNRAYSVEEAIHWVPLHAYTNIHTHT